MVCSSIMKSSEMPPFQSGIIQSSCFNTVLLRTIIFLTSILLLLLLPLTTFLRMLIIFHNFLNESSQSFDCVKSFMKVILQRKESDCNGSDPLVC